MSSTTGSSSNSSSSEASTINQFPWKLHDILKIAEETGQESIISWLPNGRAFQVHNVEGFENGMMRQKFKQTKFKSFVRQLNLWGFKKITDTKSACNGSYHHPFFIKGKEEMCHMMIRQKIKRPKVTAQEQAQQAIALAQQQREKAMSTIAATATNATTMNDNTTTTTTNSTTFSNQQFQKVLPLPSPGGPANLVPANSFASNSGSAFAAASHSQQQPLSATTQPSPQQQIVVPHQMTTNRFLLPSQSMLQNSQPTQVQRPIGISDILSSLTALALPASQLLPAKDSLLSRKEVQTAAPTMTTSSEVDNSKLTDTDYDHVLDLLSQISQQMTVAAQLAMQLKHLNDTRRRV